MKLKTKLIALNSIILFVVGAMMFLQFRSAQNKQKYEIRNGFGQSSEKLQRAISNVFYLYYHNVQNIALNKSLQSKNFDDANFYFNELVSLYPLYDMIVFVDKDGKFVASNTLDSAGKKLDLDKFKGADYSASNWFKKTKAGELVEDYDKKIYGSFFGEFKKDSLLTDIYGGERLGNYFSTPVNDEFGDLVGYIATFVNGAWVTNELIATNKALEKEGKSGAQVWVANNDGLVISEVRDSKNTNEDFLKLNVISEYDKQILASKELKEPGFIKSMFAIDNEPLYAFSEFSNNKFVNAIGWKAFVKMRSEEAFSSISVATNIFSISFLIILFFGSFIAYVVSNKLSDDLLNIANNIAGGSLNISNASESLSDHSGKLSNATSDQASSLQQTVASLNEISAMINKNTDASQSSKDLSVKSRSAAETGKGSIDKMLSSIDEISDANAEIIDQMNQNANEIQEIITVIREIEDKTKVINDIVFQTKLLSFNASVEAARAGEHGKGFSVVAEEVGNLAQHSGDAAKQIEEMLLQSVNRVEAIARNTESKVGELVERGTSKVEQGKSVARQCDSALGEILEHANNLDNMIEEIAIASVEQSQGVQEITRAMSELDKVTKQNSMIAHETSLNTQSLNEQATGLKDISILLTDLITGRNDGKGMELLDKNSASNEKVSKNGKKEKRSYSLKPNKNTDKNSNKEMSQENVVQLKTKQSHETVETRPVVTKKVASSDISVPTAGEGEWEDI
ncbi:MAG: methyl-accepting chemotaxis protein [Bacteriovoracaceae bacterium]|jgi:methyl-accepting chemotaxis protein